ncbi:SoxR reducing system RseC family protein [Idiomarina seosinensis]|uniref:Fis family transcriptional regulator n=1 Tax=Idiomarina seosinensis TaxID=281739 RepID=A0A432ZHI5_9GAMM|nr:SoxR reducing system RseC family protein [Idiomarina seosinensis]RUO77363.1 Fis family transcriptional regulator [Idiomarina seosinensis]
MKELAEVVAVEGNRITLTTELKTACSGCSHNTTCGAGILSKVFADRNTQFRVISDTKVAVGEHVEISMPESEVIRFALLLYGLPILVLLFSAMALSSLQTIPEGLVIVFAFCGFGLTFIGLKHWFRRRDVKVNQLIQLSNPQG